MTARQHAPSPLWPARLHHLQIATPQPETLARFYERAFAYRTERQADGRLLLRVGYRRLLLSEGPACTLVLAGFALADRAQLEALRTHVQQHGVAVEPAGSPLFDDGAFSVQDPDGRRLAFGLPADPLAGAAPDDALIGRLQHVVVTTLDLAAIQRFYEHTLGFVLSDRVVREDGEPTTYFYRSDPEHHSFAAFLSDGVRLDHHALEASDWNAIKDWADHFGAQELPLVWGPGRHGPGNNVFCMVADPDGNRVEVSAELEHMPLHRPAREWPHTERSLNLWGPGLLRI
jgi:catechol 2,3-dioxygenase-like lactoylglutathione lyase family enzyme